MRIAVLASPDSWYFRDLQRAGQARHDVFPVRFLDLSSYLRLAGPEILQANGSLLSSGDLILVRTMPPGSLEQVVYRMDLLGRCQARGATVVNAPRTLESAVDKYLTTSKLHEARLPTPDTATCQTVEEAMAAFEQLGRDVVIKPMFGGEGRGITRVSDQDLAYRAFRLLEQTRSVIYLQAFVPHRGYDIRLLIIGDSWLAIQRRHPTDWRTNISRGAVAETWAADENVVELGRRAAAAIGAEIAGVDILPAVDGRHFVLEVNAVPGWRALGRTLKIDVAQRVLQHATRLAEEEKNN